jgi:hypothetical protein
MQRSKRSVKLNELKLFRIEQRAGLRLVLCRRLQIGNAPRKIPSLKSLQQRRC